MVCTIGVASSVGGEAVLVHKARVDDERRRRRDGGRHGEPHEHRGHVPFADGEAFAIGERTFRAHHTPGHAVHHIAWQLDDQLFAGDVAGVRSGLGPVVPPCPPPDINVEDWQASIRKILALDLKEVHLTHYGTVREIEANLQA